MSGDVEIACQRGSPKISAPLPPSYDDRETKKNVDFAFCSITLDLLRFVPQVITKFCQFHAKQ